jgi:DNA-binding NarL/FixJ family response regulator
VTITVLVADDQPLMRSALCECLAAEPDIEVMAEATDGVEAVTLAQRLCPDVLIIDIRLPNLDGIAATRRLIGANGNGRIRVLVITTLSRDEYIFRALQAGASGFLLEDATAEEVVKAVRVIAAGGALLSPAITRRLLDRYARYLPPVVPDRSHRLELLTPRELTVFKLVARGLSNAEISKVLDIAESSVKTHVSHLLAKLGLHNRVQLVIVAYESGLASPLSRAARVNG